MPRDVRHRVEVTDDEELEVRQGIVETDAESEPKEAKQEGKVDAAEEDKKEDDDGGDDDEEVYEIESIVHHKKNMFVSVALVVDPPSDVCTRVDWPFHA